MAELPSGATAFSGNAPVSSQAQQTQLGQGGAQGGGTGPARFMQTPQTDNSTMDALMRIGGSLLDSKIKEAQASKYIDGMQRVFQGEAVKDIVAEQPDYMSIFGPTATAQGARAMAQVKQVDDFSTSLYTQLPSLREQNPDAVGKMVGAEAKRFLTGDAQTDAVVQQRMMEVIGPFYKAHVKEHAKFNQERSALAQQSNIKSAGDNYLAMTRAARSGSAITTEDLQRGRAAASDALLPIVGQSLDSWQKTVTTSVIESMNNGNHAMVGILRDSETFNNLTPEQRTAISKAEITTGKKILDEYRSSIAIDYGTFLGEAGSGQLSTNQIKAQVDKMNSDAALATGISGVPLFDASDTIALVSGNVKDVYRKFEQTARDSEAYRRQLARDAAKQARTEQYDAAKEAEAAETAMRETSQINSLLAVGSGKYAESVFPKDKVQAVDTQIIRSAMQQGKDWQSHVIRNAAKGMKNEWLAGEIRNGLTVSEGQGYTEAFGRSAELYKQLISTPGGRGAAIEYLPEQSQIDRMDIFLKAKDNRLPDEYAYTQAFAKRLPTVQSSIGVNNVSDVKDAAEGIPGASDLSESGMGRVSQMIAARTKDIISAVGTPMERAIAQATEEVQQQVEITGPLVIDRSGRAPLRDLIAGTQEEASETVTDFLNTQFAKQNTDVTWNNRPDIADFTVVRLPKDNPMDDQIFVTAVDANGKTFYTGFTPRQLRQHFEAGERFKKKPIVVPSLLE